MKIYPLLIALSLTAVSCSLDENPKDGILEDETYPNAKELYMKTVKDCRAPVAESTTCRPSLPTKP